MKLVGITNTSFDQNFIRNQLFLFDELLVLNMERAISIGGDFREERERTECELDFLSSKGLVKRIYPIEHLLEEKVLPKEIVDRFHRFSRHSDTWQDFVHIVCRSEELWQKFSYGLCKTEAEAIRAINAAIALQLRAHTLMANISETQQFSICSDVGVGSIDHEMEKTAYTVISIILDQIPIIPDMPYDEVIDFKAYPTTKRLHERLKLWIAQESMKEQDLKIVRAEVEQAIIDYREFVSRQANKNRLLQIELFCKVPLELLESLIRVTPSRPVASIIDIKRKRIDLYESELKAPRNQFAYIREIEQFAGERALPPEDRR